MSNLYVRVKTGFYTHRKTFDLRAKIGDDAFWLPPRHRLIRTAAQKKRAGNRRQGDLFWAGGCWHPVWNFGTPMTTRDIYARPVKRRKKA